MKKSKELDSPFLYLPLFIFLMLIVLILYYDYNRKRHPGEPMASLTPSIARQMQPRVQENGMDVPREQENDDTNGNLHHRKTIGKKKAEKMKRKEEQRQYREYLESVKEDERLRQEIIQEEKDKKQVALDKIRKRQEAKLAEERKQAQIARELEMHEQSRLKREHDIAEEQIRMKMAEYIKTYQLVTFDALSAQFGLEDQKIQEFIHILKSENRLTGTLDLSKRVFLYLSDNQLDHLADLVKSRGEITESDLVDTLYQLLDINCETLP